MGDQELTAEARRKAATRAAIKYFTTAFLIVVMLASLVTYAVWNTRRQERDSRDIRVAYCTQLEGLKKQNRDEVARDKKNYKRNLELLGLKDSAKLRKAAEEQWEHELEVNAPLSCPYKPSDVNR